MTLQQLHQVITIAESRSMNEASRKLFVSQPNLSAVVRELEEEAGITILSGPTGESCLHQRERNLSDMPSRSWSSIIYWNPVIFRLHPKEIFRVYAALYLCGQGICGSRKGCRNGRI